MPRIGWEKTALIELQAQVSDSLTKQQLDQQWAYDVLMACSGESPEYPGS